MLTLGTAGHIDHGKSSLVKALTSIDPDRLPEEQKRGMTIDLGFAWMELPSGATIGIVDVPGHKQFIHNVIPGLFGIDAVLLVVAADDGWMPQTEEHLRILDLLGIKHGIVALNKIDLVTNTAWLEMVEKDIDARLKGTALEQTSIIRVSARNGEGIAELKQSIAMLEKKIAPRQDIGKARLPVDRVFIVKGSGVVVTGTLSQGVFKTGDNINIIPSGINTHIRNLESFKKGAAKGLPGSRIALNLSGVKHRSIHRGDIITVAHQNHPLSRIIDTQLTLLATAETSLKNMSEVLVYLETREILGRVHLIGKKSLAPGESIFAQLRFQEDINTFLGERFIIRQQSPAKTIGGGVVLDSQAEKLKQAEILARIAFLQKRTTLELDEMILSELSKKGWTKTSSLLTNSLYPADEIATHVKQLSNQNLLQIASGYAIQPDVWQKNCQEILDGIKTLHKTDSLQSGAHQATLQAASKLPCDAFDAIAQQLVATGKLTRQKDMLCLPDKPTLSRQQESLKQTILNMFASQVATPPTISEIGKRLANSLPVTYYLIKQGVLIDLGGGVLLEKTHFERIRDEVAGLLKQNGFVSIQDINQRFGFSRKYSVPLLTYLDRLGITHREGDVRVSGQKLV